MKRLGLGVSKVDEMTTFDFVVNTDPGDEGESLGTPPPSLRIEGGGWRVKG